MRRKKNSSTNKLLFAHNVQLESYPDSIPKSRYYREEAAELLGKNVCLTGLFTLIHRENVDGINVNKILIEDAVVTNRSHSVGIDHIWVTVEQGFMQRNRIRQNRNISCSGYLYEYISKGKRNIGFKLCTVKEIPKDEKKSVYKKQ